MAAQWADGPFPLIETPEYRLRKGQESKDDEFIKGASLMAVVHNMIIRSLNAIYLQAPHVKEADVKDFLGFCHCWHAYLENHHQAEETQLFPKLEEACGEKGLMDANVEQHHEFQAGLEAFKAYLNSLHGHEAAYSPSTLLSIIDGFSTPLVTHLADEIPTLLALSRFGRPLGLNTLLAAEMRRGSDALPKTEGLPFFFLNLDRTFEDGLWSSWPPVPALVRWALVRIFARSHAGWWRFASCDYDGMPRSLYAMK